MRSSEALPQSSTAPVTLVVLAGVVALLPLAALGNEAVELKVTAYKVWASDQATEEKPPKEIEKFLRQLKKCSKKRSFRLEEKAVTETLTAGKTMKITLPERYEVRLALETDKEGKPAVLQTLINPRKEESANLLKKSPVVTQIDKIQRGGETFFLIVEFEQPSRKK
jgi:hypothetical protein